MSFRFLPTQIIENSTHKNNLGISLVFVNTTCVYPLVLRLLCARVRLGHTLLLYRHFQIDFFIPLHIMNIITDLPPAGHKGATHANR